ncbi:MAG: hypothetical protein QF535_03920, partial [Anaerolineales bacterium]|nr:hypothetical protein [Anaerolineales bacterium]
VSASIVYQSGSTKFGDTIDDIHSFTGSINQSGSFNLNDGNMSVTDTLTATTLTGTTIKDFTTISGSSISTGSFARLAVGTGTLPARSNTVITNDGTWTPAAGSNSGTLHLGPRDTTTRTVTQFFDTGTSNEVGAIEVTAGGDMDFYTKGTSWANVMTLTTGSRVGIGTTNPTGGLIDIKQKAQYEGVRCIAHDNDSYHGTFGIGDAGYTTIRSNGDRGMDLRSNSQMRFYIDDADTLGFIITAAGNVGIGETSPDTRLHVVTAYDAVNATLKVQSNDNDGCGISFWNADSGPHANSRRWQMITNGSAYGDFELFRSTSNSGNPATNVIRITKNSDVLFQGDLIMADGKGIDFSATADSSGTMSSEILDDYEEGTFTMGISATT